MEVFVNIPIRFYFVLAVLTFLVVGCGSTGSDEASPTLVAAATVPADDSVDAALPQHLYGCSNHRAHR